MGWKVKHNTHTRSKMHLNCIQIQSLEKNQKQNSFWGFNKVKTNLLQTKHGHINLKQFYNLQYI